MMVIIIWEGLLGGAAYVNTFYKIREEVGETVFFLKSVLYQHFLQDLGGGWNHLFFG